MDYSKYQKIINKNRSSKEKKKNYLRVFLIRSLIVIIIFLSVLIICKKDETIKNKIYNYVFKDDIAFTKIKKTYNKYLGGILPLKKELNTEKVFNEKLKYDDISIYKDGIKLSVIDNYLVPSIKEGMVVFIGDKDDYGNTIIIEDLDGNDIWYGNIANTNLKLYDYVEEGSYVGEVSKELYMVFTNGDKYLDYEDFIN